MSELRAFKHAARNCSFALDLQGCVLAKMAEELKHTYVG